MFAILEPSLRGARVLDLFAGSGAAGIEALSRGAAEATFVERDARACAVIRENLSRAHLPAPPSTAEVVRADAIAWLTGGPAASGMPFDLVISDPPYDEPELLLRSLELVPSRLAPGAIVVAKHFWRQAPPDTLGLLASERQRRFGETALTFYRRQEAR
jgi:16S rRNA (guanine966-N2)-methyltransferase